MAAASSPKGLVRHGNTLQPVLTRSYIPGDGPTKVQPPKYRPSRLQSSMVVKPPAKLPAAQDKDALAPSTSSNAPTTSSVGMKAMPTVTLVAVTAQNAVTEPNVTTVVCPIKQQNTSVSRDTLTAASLALDIAAANQQLAEEIVTIADGEDDSPVDVVSDVSGSKSTVKEMYIADTYEIDHERNHIPTESTIVATCNAGGCTYLLPTSCTVVSAKINHNTAKSSVETLETSTLRQVVSWREVRQNAPCPKDHDYLASDNDTDAQMWKRRAEELEATLKKVRRENSVLKKRVDKLSKAVVSYQICAGTSQKFTYKTDVNS